MAEFAALNERLTEACKTRLGELADLRFPNGPTATGVRIVVDRDRELIGQNGQISDIRTTAKIAKADIGENNIVGTKITTAEAEVFIVDSPLGDDGQFVEVALR